MVVILDLHSLVSEESVREMVDGVHVPLQVIWGREDQVSNGQASVSSFHCIKKNTVSMDQPDTDTLSYTVAV